ncbi:hypothetical protein ACX1C1_07530 [Paenibacillus sp. strain BS8-2]
MRIFLSMLLTVITIAVIAGCGTEQKALFSQAGTEVDEQKQRDESETSTYDDAPIHPSEVDSVEFSKSLQSFPALVNSKSAENLSDLSAEQVFDWVKATELIYQTIMSSNTAITEEQRLEVLAWLQAYMSEELIKQRVAGAFHPVEGGYRIIDPYQFQNFNILQIERVVHLDVVHKDDVTTLTADLVVMVEQPIKVVYEITTTDGVSKLTGYQFEMIKNTQ